MKSWEKFLEKTRLHEDVLRSYTKLRKLFQKYEWSEKDLEKPSYYPKNVMMHFHKFQSLHDKLFTELKSFFPDIDHTDFTTYIEEKMKKINLEIPLEKWQSQKKK